MAFLKTWVVIPPAQQAYDKKSSFFDNISSELKDRDESKRGMEFRSEERKKNMETFGQGSVDNYRGGYRSRGRGRGGYRGRGRGFANAGTGYPARGRGGGSGGEGQWLIHIERARYLIVRCTEA